MCAPRKFARSIRSPKPFSPLVLQNTLGRIAGSFPLAQAARFIVSGRESISKVTEAFGAVPARFFPGGACYGRQCTKPCYAGVPASATPVAVDSAAQNRQVVQAVKALNRRNVRQ